MVDVELKTLIDDANELRQFIDRSNRPNVKAKLIDYVKELEIDINKRKAATKPTKDVSAGNQLRTYDIKNYAWDQSEKFVKLYLSLTGVEKLDPSNLESNFTNRSFHVKVNDLSGHNYEFTMKNLLHDINPSESLVKLKKDNVLIMAKKVNASNWSCLTQTELQLKEKNDSQWKPKADDKADPGDGLMNIMKQMYETGDDEMKRTIAKAWTESREKQMSGEM